MRNIFLAIISLVFFVNSAFASTGDNDHNAKVLVQSSFARESIPGTSISSAYMAINNISTKDLRLISATSSVTDRIEIHEHTMANGLMRMRQVEYVDISAKDTVLFQPSGLHLMIFDLKQPLKAKENITITLHFDDQSSIDVNYTIKGLKQKKHHH
jgi:copper(I)-binding protein|tara:strand:+ start:349 stop:816 length:468 start_codon:yes stop_codon:yes gene_type:complete